MQCKVLITSIFITACLSATTLQAQEKSTVLKTSIKNNKTDSSAKNKPTAKGGAGLLASNAAPSKTNEEKLSYNHVPLAGEKAYFGDMDEYVNDFVRKYMEHNNRTLSSVQSNSATPFSVIDNILEQKKMPKELKYLAVIESALNHNAVSHAGAVGPWQMMETTARMMGLTVSRKNDERKDWNKSTAAATKYLDLLYSQLNDWLLVVAAYNSGPTPVQKAIEKTGSHNFWAIKEYLPRETQGHVLAFIATASIFENLSKFISLGSIPVDFKFSKEKEEEPTPVIKDPVAAKVALAGAPTTPIVLVKKPAFTEDELKNMNIIRIDQPISFELLAVELGMDKKQLNRWNPDYDQFINHQYSTPFYKLRVPKDKTDLLLQKKDYLMKKSVAFLKENKQ